MSYQTSPANTASSKPYNLSKIINHERLHNFRSLVLGTVAAAIIRALYASIRWERVNLDPNSKLWTDNPQMIMACWHGRILMWAGNYWHAHSKNSTRAGSVLISRHRDGRMIAAAARWLGIDSVAGSSTRGGGVGMFQLLKRLTRGESVGITPDGPRGPVHTSKIGVVALASRTGIPIYPFTYSAEKYWRLGSWDKMIVPKPFSRAIAIVGEPLVIPKDLKETELETFRAKLDQILRELTERADKHFTAIKDPLINQLT